MHPTDALSQHLFAMACNNAWANHRLLGVCSRLSDEEFGAPRTGFFGSLRATANHLITVDWFYVDALERAFAGREPHDEPGRFFEPEEPFATCERLVPAQREVDRRLVELCRTLTDERLLRQPVRIRRRRGESVDLAPRLLAHLFQHQIHHRGQMHAMLSSTEQSPPQLDEFFCAGEAHLRADDLAALGLAEDDVWG